LVHRLLGWPGEVDDVVQEVFLAALRGLPRFRNRSSLATWLTRITINECRSQQRRRRLWWLAPSLALRALRGSAARAEATEERTDEPADHPALEREKFERVRLAVGRLPARYREVVVLRYLEQMSIEEISEVLTTRRETLQVRLHRARSLLRESLGELVRE